MTDAWSRALLEKLTVPQTVEKSPKVHYHVHKNLPLVSLHNQINPVPDRPFYLV